MASRVMIPKQAKPKLTQAEFDEAVQSNINDFDMEAGEAVQSAAKEFEMQGYDLSCVLKSADGGDTSSHPMAIHTRALADTVNNEGQHTAPAMVAPLLEAIQSQLQPAAGAGAVPEDMFTVAAKEGTVGTVLACVVRLLGTGDSDAAAVQIQALRLLTRMLQTPAMREAFREASGTAIAAALLKAQLQPKRENWQVAEAVATLAAAAASQDEMAKCSFMDNGLAGDLVALLQQPTLPLTAAAAAAAALAAFVTADDEGALASKAFMHARMLSKNHTALSALLGSLKRVGAGDTAAAVQLLNAVRQLAANDEICRGFCDEGGAEQCLSLLRGAAGAAELERSALAALRQLANSDSVKAALAEAGALSDICRVLEAHRGACEVTEPALGLLSAMTLRMPAIAAQAAQAGAVDALTEALVDSAGAGPSAGPAGRQACMALRNMVVRNRDLRPAFLERDAEVALRRVGAAHPSACKDAASAALRDLGLDNYKLP